MIQQVPPPFEIALDIGHSSIGWAIFQNGEKFDLLGTGVVLFPADDCLAIKRRTYRRQRRHVRATRQRIDRLKKLLLHVGVLSEVELNQPGCAWSWKLAAEVLSGNGRILTWPELWDVLRWYAHNRGYDGNARWSRQEKTTEDTEKEEEARGLLQKYGTTSMAETFCAVLGIIPLAVKKSSQVRFKGLGAAFPRETVLAEVKRLLTNHLGHLSGMSTELIQTLIDNDDDAWKTIPVPSVKLPKRYKGSYLFGQSIPRFDNRIITSCPITYGRIIANGGDKKKAIRDSKVPVKKCREFLLFRWSMVLANLTVNDGHAVRRLTSEERTAIHQIMVKGDPEKQIKTSHAIKAGHLTKTQLKDVVVKITQTLRNNIDSYFLTPEADKALWLRPENISGRAPYTRQVMKEAIKDVFEGNHPMEEGHSLYLSEEVRQAQLQRTLEEKTNNHLVRHRVLITRRLVNDIIKSYADTNASRIARITIEVNRDLQSFSGMTNEQIKQDVGLRLADHSKVVKKLKEHLGETTQITAGLIRKARIAEDLNWTCPYTGQIYGAKDLVHGIVDKDHIIPRTLRPSDSLESLVITFSEVNRMKKNRTGLEFIKAFEGKPVEGKPELSLFTKNQYLGFIKRLNESRGHDQDKKRKEKRKKLLELEKYEEKGFLPKDLTQTSHLVRLAATEIEKEFDGLVHKPRIVSLPGSVTWATRIAWDLYGCIAAYNPQVQKLLEQQKEEPQLNIKRELRNVTHQHHALDACVIGYTSHFLPNNGGLWEALINRNRRPEQIKLLLATKIFSPDGSGRAHIIPLSDRIKQQITERLKECRVVQHVPKRMDGLIGLEQNTRGIISIEVPDPDSTKGKLKEIWNNQNRKPLPVIEKLDGVIVKLQRFGPRDPKNQKRERPPTYEKATKLLGLCPKDSHGKLRSIKGVRIVEANFGLALWHKDGNPDGEPITRIILWHKVWSQIKAIAENENGGNWPQILRAGQIIYISKAGRRSNYCGYWRIKGAENQEQRGMTLKLSRVDSATSEKIAASVETLLECGMTVVKSDLTGVSLNI